MKLTTVELMLATTEAKLAKIQLVLEAKERENNNDIQAAHEMGQRLGEHYWQEAHELRQMKKSAELLRDILLEVIDKGDTQ